MSLHDALNTDLNQLWPMVRRGFAWWTGQLAGLVPERWRPRGRAGLIAEPLESGPGFQLSRQGQLLETLTIPLRRARRVTLMLPADQALVRDSELPSFSAEDTRRMVALEIDRLMPFPEGAAVHDVELAAAGAGPRRLVLIGAALRQDVIFAVDQARAFGLEPTRVGAIWGGAARFDFLRALGAGAGMGADDRRSLYWATAIGGLIAFNVFLLIFRDMNSVATLREVVEAQRDSVAIALRIRNAATVERDQRARLAAYRVAASPSRLLATVNAVLPRGAWVHRLAWNGQAVRLVGFKGEGVDVARALRAAPDLTNVRALAAVEGAVDDRRKQPFDVAAERRSAVPSPAATAPGGLP